MLKVEHGRFSPWKFNQMCLSSNCLELTYPVGGGTTRGIVLGQGGKALAGGKLHGWPLWEARVFPYGRCSWTPHCSRWMCPEQSCSPQSAHTGASSWQKLWPVTDPHRSCLCQDGLYPMVWINGRAVLEELQPVRKNYAGAVHEGLHPMGGTLCWSRGIVWRETSSQVEGLLTTATTIPYPPCSAWGGWR